MHVEDQTQAKGLLIHSELIVEESLCVNLRGRLIHCSSCEDSCAIGAISLTPDSVDHDDMLCTGCNSCLPSCPAGALRSTGFVPVRFLRALTQSGQTDIHCRTSSDGGGGIVIPCHGVLDARLLAAARAEGVTELRLHGLNQCESCRLGDAREHVNAVISQLGEWLGENAPRLDLKPLTGESGCDGERNYQDQPHMDRRAFLRFGGANGITRAVDWLVPGLAQEEEDAESLPFYQADDYPQRAAPYQRELVMRAGTMPWRAGQALPFKTRRLNAHCSACLICGKRCPTGALQASETEQARVLSFDPAACTDCGLCEAICPHDALIVEPQYDPAELQGRTTLLCRQQIPCRQCHTPFMSTTEGDDLCPVCNNEQELDEAWLDMLSD